MRIPSDSKVQILRHLSAARFFLPVKLSQPDGYAAEPQYLEFLHHREYEMALECLEDLGSINNNHADEFLFWSELLSASKLMGLSEHITLCTNKLENCTNP